MAQCPCGTAGGTARGLWSSKSVAGAIDTFRKNGITGDLLKRLVIARDGPDATAGKEAKAVIARLQSGAQAKLDEAKKLKSEILLSVHISDLFIKSVSAS